MQLFLYKVNALLFETSNTCSSKDSEHFQIMFIDVTILVNKILNLIKLKLVGIFWKMTRETVTDQRHQLF